MREQTAERDLVGRMRARDGSAVGDLASLYGPRIQQLAFRYLKNREDAEEVAQDVLMKVYRKIDAFRGDAALSSWIYRITFNAAMSRLRKSATTSIPVSSARRAGSFRCSRRSHPAMWTRSNSARSATTDSRSSPSAPPARAHRTRRRAANRNATAEP